MNSSETQKPPLPEAFWISKVLLCRFRGGGLLLLGRSIAEDRVSAAGASPGASRHHRKGERGQHEDDGRDGSGAGEGRSSGAWAKCGLATHASEGGSNVGAFAALEENYTNQEYRNDNVNSRNEDNHLQCCRSTHGIALQNFCLQGLGKEVHGAEGGT